MAYADESSTSSGMTYEVTVSYRGGLDSLNDLLNQVWARGLEPQYDLLEHPGDSVLVLTVDGDHRDITATLQSLELVHRDAQDIGVSP